MFAKCRRWIIALVTLLLALLPAAFAHAQAVLQSYASSGPLQLGLIVQLETKPADTVAPLTQTAATKMFGVVVNPNSSPVSLSATSTSQQVYVATNGTAEVLVSTQNGAIKSGDYITISSLDGIGMKAGSSDTTILGKATGAFNGTSDSISTANIKEASGQQTTVALGRLAVSVSVGRNPLLANQSDLPGFLQRASQSIANKPVKAPIVYLGLGILLVTAIIAGSLLYAGVRNSMVAIGRNPLSKKSIFRGLIQVVLTSLIIFIVGLFAVYLLLRY